MFVFHFHSYSYFYFYSYSYSYPYSGSVRNIPEYSAPEEVPVPADAASSISEAAEQILAPCGMASPAQGLSSLMTGIQGREVCGRCGDLLTERRHALATSALKNVHLLLQLLANLHLLLQLRLGGC